MSYCCCRPKYNVYIEPRYEDKFNCCLSDEFNLIKLKNTNYELKNLINRLDHLSDSFDRNKSSACWNCCNTGTTWYNMCDECNLCRSQKEKNKKNFYQYNVTICNDCERMLEISSELESRNYHKNDSKIYPLEKYASGREYLCDKCDRCVEIKERRRSRSRSRNFYSVGRVVTPEPRPQWNGGPWLSYYPMTNLKLSEMKR